MVTHHRLAGGLDNGASAEGRLRICVVGACPVPYPRGTPVRVTRFAEALAALGHEVHLVTYGFGSGEVDPAVRMHRGPRVPGMDPGPAGPSFGKLAVLDPILAVQLHKLLRSHDFDIVHAHHYEGLMAALAAAGPRAPVVYDAHAVLESELPSYARWIAEGLKRSFGRWIDHTLPARARFVVAASERLRDHLVSEGVVPSERIAVVGNGVEAEALSTTLGGPHAAPSGEGVLAYAGNLAPYQGIDKLLEAFRRVLRDRPRARLRILTDNSFRPYEQLAAELGVRNGIELRDVPFESLYEELAEAHVAVNPRPRCDGVPMKNLNYMAASRPLVGFAESLHPAEHELTGLAVQEVTGEALGEGISWLLDRPEEGARLGRAARLTIERKYTWARQAERMEAIYRALLGSGTT
jgi:glycosyltransferase involved in cell wall biosynthesis